MAIHKLVHRQLAELPTESASDGRAAQSSRRTTTESAVVGASDLGDFALISSIAANDLTALAALYDRYRAAAFGLAVRITRDHSLAEDVVQDAFLGVWRSAPRYDARRGGCRTWIMTIVHHRAVDITRRRRLALELPSTESSAPASLVTPDIWAEVAQHLDRDTIVGALATLRPAQREAIELAYFSGLTQAEIARYTGAPLGTIKSRVRLGLLALRDAIAPANDVVWSRKARYPLATAAIFSRASRVKSHERDR